MSVASSQLPVPGSQLEPTTSFAGNWELATGNSFLRRSRCSRRGSRRRWSRGRRFGILQNRPAGTLSRPDRQGQGRCHKDPRQHPSSFLKARHRAAWAERRLAHSAKGRGDIYVFSALDEDEQDQQDADQDVNRHYDCMHRTSFVPREFRHGGNSQAP